MSASKPETGGETNEKEVEEKDDDETEEKVCRAVPNFLKRLQKICYRRLRNLRALLHRKFNWNRRKRRKRKTMRRKKRMFVKNSQEKKSQFSFQEVAESTSTPEALEPEHNEEAKEEE